MKVNHLFIFIFLLVPLREAWIKAVRRELLDKKGTWQPVVFDRVCSIHFVDRLATNENRIPNLFLGYESKEKKARRPLFKKPLKKSKKR